MRQDTLFMTLSLMNRYLQNSRIKKEIYQLIATTCLFIAAKYEEIYPPAIEDYVYICADAYSKSDILRMEAMILNELEFNLVNTSPLTLLGIYASQCNLSITKVNFCKKQYDLCQYFLHLTEMSYDMIEFNCAIRVAAAISISCRILRVDGLGLEVLSRDFATPQEQIRSCSMSLFLLLCNPVNDKLSAIRRKFGQDTYSNVASLKISVKGVI